MKWMFVAALAAASLAPVVTVHAQSARHGTIVDMKPIDNRGDDESQVHRQGRKLGASLGSLLGFKAVAVANGQVANAVVSAAPAVGEAAGGAIAGNGPAAHYMVKLQLDDGRVMSLVQTGHGVEGLHVGSKVTVSGSGNTATLAAD